MKRPVAIIVVVVLLGVAAFWLWNQFGDKKQQAGRGPMGPPDVTTMNVHAGAVPMVQELPGRTTAYRIAEVRPQVTGIVVERLFTEGAEVSAGQQLYQLDASQYEVALQGAEASLNQALASQHSADRKFDRYQELLGTRAISQQDFDDAQIALEQANAMVAVAEAKVAAAKLDLAYTKVTAPLSGRIGRSQITEGALVTAGQSEPLTVITQLDPIYVDIKQASAESLRLRNAGVSAGDVAVEIVPDDATRGYTGVGKLQFTDVLVDESTGSLQLRALFPNPDRRLLPGMFVTTRLNFGTENGILVPQKAVSRNVEGAASVWVVDPDNVVHLEQISTERAIGDQWLVSDGLSEGAQIVIEGMQRLSQGVSVVTHGKDAG